MVKMIKSWYFVFCLILLFMIEMNWSLMPQDMFFDWMKIIEAYAEDNNSDKDYRY